MKFFKIFNLFLFISFTCSYGQEPFIYLTPYYELHSYSDISSQVGRKEMGEMINKFRKYFHKKFSPFCVILFDNEDQMKKFAFDKLAKTGKQFVPIITYTAEKFNLIAHEAAHKLLVVYADENWNYLFPDSDSIHSKKLKDVKVTVIIQTITKSPTGVTTTEVISGNYDTAYKNKESEGWYGHRYIPDWIDEAIAVLCEDSTTQQNRRIHMRKTINKRISLTEVLSMRETTPLFYSEILSVMEFIIEKEGNEIVEKIVVESIKKKTIEEIFKEHAKNIPSDLKELEKQWVEWVKKQK